MSKRQSAFEPCQSDKLSLGAADALRAGNDFYTAVAEFLV